MKSKILSITIMILALTAAVFAEDKAPVGWNKSLTFNLAVTQNAYSDSWAGGEAGNASWVSNLNSIIEGPVGSRLIWKTTGKFSFGQTHIQDQETKAWKKPVKSTDLIDLESVLRYQTGWYVNPFFGVRFESQFLDASIPQINRYVNPIKLTESAGFTRRFYQKEKDFIDTRIGFALRQYIDRKVEDVTTKRLKTSTISDGGVESVTDLSLTLNKNILITSKLTLYKAITVSDRSTPFWPTLDANWENILAASVTKYITVNLYTQWLYDKQIDVRGRFKETLALGFTYKLL
jgi:Protein of unknown function (DUF3078)